jgi:hypothetical protein
MTQPRTNLISYIKKFINKTHEILFKIIYFGFGPPLGFCGWKPNSISFGVPEPENQGGIKLEPAGPENRRALSRKLPSAIPNSIVKFVKIFEQ